MIEPRWYSHPYPPEGASAAEGLRNQLGKPDLDHLTILIRESAQNSWDAKLDNAATVDYRVDLRTISAAESSAWRQHLLRGAPADVHLPLRSALNGRIIRALLISDRGTRGLGGSTRADKVTETDRDFVSFMRNSGEPRDVELGGGTYGFGKGILYLMSKPGVILVHTRCRYEGRLETRLMGVALWRSYRSETAADTRRYTGRHWWGDDSGEVIEPLVGSAAESVAQQLGLQPFTGSETGTTIVIIDPELGDRTPAEAAQYLADTIAWQLWPKMIPDGRGVSPMRFAVTCDGIQYRVPDPTKERPLDLFVSAYKEMLSDNESPLYCKSPRRLLGRLGLKKRIAVPFEPSAAAQSAGFDRVVHHVCLMRPAELVVTYWPGPKPASELLSYAGVFRADVKMDQCYADAEPPTHDSWNYPSLKSKQDRTFVRTTFTRLKEAADRLIALNIGHQSDVAAVSLGAASDKFAPLVGGAWGIGSATNYGRPGDTKPPGPQRRGVSDGTDEEIIYEPGRHDQDGSFADSGASVVEADEGSSMDRLGSNESNSVPLRKQRPRIALVGEPYLDERSGFAVLVQEFRLPVTGRQRIRAELSVALNTDGGRESDPPAGAAEPELIGWEDDSGMLTDTESLVADGGEAQVWKAVVRPAPDTMTDISVRVEAITG
ncbi:hypothetical protein [Nocardia sp. BMG111209]|uniref:hypothetical protein n=1 Tax=Nocardia sp. BMG111209 TaxID=1160137 RepID=UPI0003A76A8F|nr:hypothetical protein [Nocardia sp. BMG111209]